MTAAERVGAQQVGRTAQQGTAGAHRHPLPLTLQTAWRSIRRCTVALEIVGFVVKPSSLWNLKMQRMAIWHPSVSSGVQRLRIFRSNFSFQPEEHEPQGRGCNLSICVC